MKPVSQSSVPNGSGGSDSSTHSQGSASGATPSDLPDGLGTYRSGPDPVRVSLSPTPESEEEPETSVTSGRTGVSSFSSADLQSCLANRLRARLAGSGSRLYKLIWRHWDISSSGRICALRASVPRTGGSASSSQESIGAGWQTPTVNDEKSSDYSYSRGEAKLASWATPAARDWKDGRASEATMERNSRPLSEQATMLAAWPTPIGKDASTAPSRSGDGSPALRVVATLADSGLPPTGSSVGTIGLAQLSPSHSRWLMGLPAEWLSACPEGRPRRSTGGGRSAGSGTRSSRK